MLIINPWFWQTKLAADFKIYIYILVLNFSFAKKWCHSIEVPIYVVCILKTTCDITYLKEHKIENRKTEDSKINNEFLVPIRICHA